MRALKFITGHVIYNLNYTYKFQLKTTLVKHIKDVHEIDYKFQCSSCNKKFKNARKLWEHKRIHKEKKVNFCHFDNCEFSSNLKRNLIDHVEKFHEGMAKFSCSFCDRTFHTMGKLTDHNKNIHTKEGKGHRSIFPCHKCEYTSFQKSMLSAHIASKHKEIDSMEIDNLECTTCEGSFGTKIAFAHHMKQFHAIEI